MEGGSEAGSLFYSGTPPPVTQNMVKTRALIKGRAGQGGKDFTTEGHRVSAVTVIL
jgi:hypothetical protein